MYNIVLISPSLLTPCLDTDTLSEAPGQRSEVQGDRKDSKAFGKAVTQTGHTFASHSTYSNSPPYRPFGKKLSATSGKK